MVKPHTDRPPDGRSPLILDEPTRAKLIRLGAVQATPAELARSFATTETGIGVFFEDCPEARAVFDQASADALEQLRAAQFKLAEKSSTMAIFLGKHYLGQADRRESDQSAQAEADAAAERLRHKLADIAARLGDPGDRGAGEDA
jgi:hypothetical protein